MKNHATILLVSLTLLLSGCLHSPVDESWGEALSATGDAQVANPVAPDTLEGAKGIDPVSAEAVAQRYYEGQRRQQSREAPSIVITDGN
jgi:hypothetical protein